MDVFLDDVLYIKEAQMEIGNIGKKHYYLEQNPLTKELSIVLDNWETGKRRTYTNKNVIRKIICMLV